MTHEAGLHRRRPDLELICHVRLKRSGAWWLEGNGNAMLRIRCAIYNGTFPQVFADYTATQTVTPSADNK